MFFYLLYNSTLIEKELDEKNKMLKLLIYGGISYIVLHATLFIGGSESLLFSFQKYFWLFLVLDCVTMYIINGEKMITIYKNHLHKKKIINNKNNNNYNNNYNSNNNSNNNTHSILKKKKNKVKFVEPVYDGDSSDSDIGTDIDLDLENFKKSLNF